MGWELEDVVEVEVEVDVEIAVLELIEADPLTIKKYGEDWDLTDRLPC